MPLLAREKRQLAAQTASAALRAEAAESDLCGYFAVIALVGIDRERIVARKVG
jgi:hypothetical protein